MKNKINFLFVFILLVSATWSCKKDENKVLLYGGTAPSLSASVGSIIPLDPTTQNSLAVKFLWTNPNYKFNTGNSSQTVSYSLQVDTAGANFASSLIQTLPTDIGATGVAITQKALNAALTKMKLSIGVQHNLEFRVVSSIGAKATELVSNIVKLSAAPYLIPPLVTPPSTKTLYIVGDATPGGWPPLSGAAMTAQKFTIVQGTNDTEYKLTLQLNGGGAYKFVATPGQWSEQWSVKVKKDPALIYGGTLTPSGDDALAPPTTGNYVIDVDFQVGTFSVTKQ